MKKIVLAISVATLALAGTAYAAADKTGGDRTIARADALARAEQMFDRADANKDGKLDSADREARRTAAFDRIDANKDGSVSRAEFAAMRPQMGGEHRGMQHGQRGEMGEHRMGMRQMQGHRMHGRGMMLRMADANRDGAVSKAEFTTAAAARFDRTDTNRDGQITAAERQAARTAMRETMRNRAPGNAAPLPVN